MAATDAQKNYADSALLMQKNNKCCKSLPQKHETHNILSCKPPPESASR